MRERFPKLGKSFITSSFFPLLQFYIIHGRFSNFYFCCTSLAVNHLDYLGVQVAWVTGPWFLSIFVNMLPWESGQVLNYTRLISLRPDYFNH